MYYGDLTFYDDEVCETLQPLSDCPEIVEYDKQLIRDANEKLLKCMDKCIAKATVFGHPRSCIQKLRKERNRLVKIVSGLSGIEAPA